MSTPDFEYSIEDEYYPGPDEPYYPGQPPYYAPPYRPVPPVEEEHEYRKWWLILISVFCVHLVLVLNYIHLQRTQKVKYSSRTARIVRIVVFTLMPTLVIAELIVNSGRTFLTLLTMDGENFSAHELYKDARKYVCGVLGMRISPKPAFVEDVEVEERAAVDGQQDEQAESLLNGDKKVELLPALADIQNTNDLQLHRQRWNSMSVLRIVLLTLAIAQAIGTITLFIRASDGWIHTIIASDKRNLVAAISSIVCSLMGIVLICCRSEWSLKPLSDSVNTQTHESGIKIFILEFILASFFNVAPFSPYNDKEMPFSWFHTLTSGLSGGGLLALIIALSLIWLMLSMFQSQLKARMPKINWRFVTLLATLPVVGLLIWISIELILYVINDIIQLVELASGNYGYRDYADPWAKFIPFC